MRKLVLNEQESLECCLDDLIADLEKEKKLIEELIAYSKIAVDPIFAIEMLLKTQDYNKVEYRKQEILELIKNEKISFK